MRGSRYGGLGVAGTVTVLAMLLSGCTLLGWGTNDRGELGDGTRWFRSEPTPAARNPGWSTVDAGSSYSCGITFDGALHCWGSPIGGQLGTGTNLSWAQTTPEQVGSATDWTAISAGGFGGSLPELEDPLASPTCGLRAPGRLYCWGTEGGPTPRRVGTADDWVAVAAGAFHVCGIRAPGDLYCWGRNDFGQLGDGTTTERDAPVRIGTDSDWTDVTTGFGVHTCGIRARQLYCWGHNTSGQLGDGTTTDRPTPTRVGTESDWTDVSGGGAGEYIWWDPWGSSTFTAHTCGLRGGGALFCWGENSRGQLGDGTTTNRTSPVREGLDTTWRSLSAGGARTCAIRPSSEMYCWGVAAGGFPPPAPITPVVTPTKVQFDQWYAVSLGAFHSQALRTGDDSF